MSLIKKTNAMALSTALIVVDINPTWENTLCHPQTVFLSLGVRCVSFMYVCEVIHDILL